MHPFTRCMHAREWNLPIKLFWQTGLRVVRKENLPNCNTSSWVCRVTGCEKTRFSPNTPAYRAPVDSVVGWRGSRCLQLASCCWLLLSRWGYDLLRNGGYTFPHQPGLEDTHRILHRPSLGWMMSIPGVIGNDFKRICVNIWWYYVRLDVFSYTAPTVLSSSRSSGRSS